MLLNGYCQEMLILPMTLEQLCAMHIKNFFDTILFCKHWLHDKGFFDSYKGGLNSFGFSLIFIAMLSYKKSLNKKPNF